MPKYYMCNNGVRNALIFYKKGVLRKAGTSVHLGHNFWNKSTAEKNNR